MYAIIQDGGHQYKVEEGQVCRIQLKDVEGIVVHCITCENRPHWQERGAQQWRALCSFRGLRQHIPKSVQEVHVRPKKCAKIHQPTSGAACRPGCH